MVDDIDRRILQVLQRNARTPTARIAQEVGLSPAPVARRIERLEADGVIAGYTTIVDQTRAGGLEAFTEIRLTGTTETADIEDLVREVPEVHEFFATSGDPDVLLRLRVDDVDHLQRVVNALRRTGRLTGTKTLIVMRTWIRSPGDRP